MVPLDTYADPVKLRGLGIKEPPPDELLKLARWLQNRKRALTEDASPYDGGRGLTHHGGLAQMEAIAYSCQLAVLQYEFGTDAIELLNQHSPLPSIRSRRYAWARDFWTRLPPHPDFPASAEIVSMDRRYFRSEQTDRFLSAVLDSCSSRVWTMEKGFPLYRAQIGNAWQTGDLGEKVAYPFPAERMKPLDDRAHEGRVNPKGIPCLYLATSREVAMSETRPAPTADISVGRFETVSDLRIIKCTERHGKMVGLFEPEDGKTDETVWATIDKAFGEPVLRAEDRADYAPTQIIAELMRINGYDGIAYRSQFDSEGFNVALFDLNSAQLTQCHVYTNTAVQYKFSGPWGGYSD